MLRASTVLRCSFTQAGLLQRSIQSAGIRSTTPAVRRHTPLRAMAAQSDDQHCYRYPRPSVTVDAAIVSRPEAAGQPLQLLLIQRKNPPCKGQWALPGGFVDENEPLHAAAARELEEETSVKSSDTNLFQVGAFGDPSRDPRGWTVTVAYAALVPTSRLGVKAAVRHYLVADSSRYSVMCDQLRSRRGGRHLQPCFAAPGRHILDDAADAKWFPVGQLPPLAFDHKLVVRTAFEKLAERGEVASEEEMKQELQSAAQNLSGPWDPPTE